MARLAQQLKERFFLMVDRVKVWSHGKSQDQENKGGDTAQLTSVQERGVHVAARSGGPTPPDIPKGPPAQTNGNDL